MLGDETSLEARVQVLTRRMTRVKVTDLALWLHQFALLLRSGIDMVRSLEILEQQEPNPRLKHVTGQVRYQVWSAGAQLSRAASLFPKLFPATVLLLMEAGETSGDLSSRLEQAAVLLDHQSALTNRIKQAVTTPLVTMGVCFALVFFVVQAIMPRFLMLFADLHVKQPLITRLVVLIVHLVNSPVFALGVGGIAAFTWLYWQPLQQAGMTLMLTWSVTRKLTGGVLAITFCEVTARLYTDGVPITAALEMLSRTTGYRYHARVLAAVGKRFREGIPLHDSVRQISYFPRVVSEMMMVGEETGTLGDSLLSAARLLDEQSQDLLRNIVALVEPLSMVLVGGIMLFFILGVFLPIYQLLQVIH